MNERDCAARTSRSYETWRFPSDVTARHGRKANVDAASPGRTTCAPETRSASSLEAREPDRSPESRRRPRRRVCVSSVISLQNGGRANAARKRETDCGLQRRADKRGNAIAVNDFPFATLDQALGKANYLLAPNTVDNTPCRGALSTTPFH